MDTGGSVLDNEKLRGSPLTPSAFSLNKRKSHLPGMRGSRGWGGRGEESRAGVQWPLESGQGS